MFIFIAIIAFGILIAIHELGHFIAAKLLNVKVNEFAIGMGPKLISKQGKETLYSLRALPLGGFCSMDEDVIIDDESEADPRAFSAKKRWQRVIILLSGGFANIIAAFIIVLIVASGAVGFVGTTITHIGDGFPDKGVDSLMVGDTLVSINGERLYYANDIFMFTQPQLARSGYVNLVVRRNGDLVILDRFLFMPSEVVITGLIDGFKPNIGQPQQLMVGDTVLSINDIPITNHYIFSTILIESDDDYMNLVIKRDYEIINLNNFPLRRHDYLLNGQIVHRYGIEFARTDFFNYLSFNQIEATPFEILRFSAYSTFNYIRLIRVSLAMLFSGAAGIGDMGGPVAIVDAMNTIGQQAPDFTQALIRIASFTAFIGINVAIVNLLPIPALDGERIVIIVITWVFEKITKRKPDPKYEAYINNGAFILLLGLMVFFLFNDILRIIDG